MPEFNATVLIATHNRAHLLPRCLESILAQRLEPQQIIVMDDGSTDGTVEALAPYRDRVEYYRKPNSGKSAALNHAIGKVTGDYLWIFDDDDVALPTALESHARGFSSNSAAGFTYSSFYNGTADAAGGLNIVSEQRIPHVPEGQLFPELLFWNLTKGQPATVVKTRCYRDVGPFDESLVRSQDYEMLLRLSHRFPGVGVEDFTFIKQIDSQLDAPGVSNAPASDRSSLWLAYDADIFRKLHRELAPLDYVPERAAAHRLSQSEERLFRLRRMAMMALRELWDEATADLAAFASALPGTGQSAPSVQERRLLRLAMADRYGAGPRLDRRQIAAVRRATPGRRYSWLRASLRHGLWQSAVASLRKRRPVSAARMLILASRLLP